MLWYVIMPLILIIFVNWVIGGFIFAIVIVFNEANNVPDHLKLDSRDGQIRLAVQVASPFLASIIFGWTIKNESVVARRKIKMEVEDTKNKSKHNDETINPIKNSFDHKNKSLNKATTTLRSQNVVHNSHELISSILQARRNETKNKTINFLAAHSENNTPKNGNTISEVRPIHIDITQGNTPKNNGAIDQKMVESPDKTKKSNNAASRFKRTRKIQALDIQMPAKFNKISTNISSKNNLPEEFIDVEECNKVLPLAMTQILQKQKEKEKMSQHLYTIKEMQKPLNSENSIDNEGKSNEEPEEISKPANNILQSAIMNTITKPVSNTVKKPVSNPLGKKPIQSLYY